MKVIVKTVAGSHLFGTNTPSSDMDYKGIFMPTEREILLGNYPDGVNETTGNDQSRNSKDDVDVELYSLKKFLKMIKRGDTAALELLFTPSEQILEKSEAWDRIVANRDKFLSSQVSAMIGYARQQANKYGIKGSRMGELSNCIAAMKEVHKVVNFNDAKLKHGWEYLKDKLKDYDHIHFVELEVNKNMENITVPAIDILGKKFDWHCGFIYVLEILKKIYKNYGHRAREAKKNNGIDWKALSHAARVSYQGLELLQTGKVTLPLPEKTRKTVVDIKLGKMDYKDVQTLLEDLLTALEVARENSLLPQELEQEMLDDFLVSEYKKVLDIK